jgi:hypothetical protein
VFVKGIVAARLSVRKAKPTKKRKPQNTPQGTNSDICWISLFGLMPSHALTRVNRLPFNSLPLLPIMEKT